MIDNCIKIRLNIIILFDYFETSLNIFASQFGEKYGLY